MYKFNVGDLVVGTRSGATGYGSSILKINSRKIWGKDVRNYHLSPVALPRNGVGYDEADLRKANVLDHVKERFKKFFKIGYYAAKWQR
jgi:hypothetical protein